jgi:hypothetical protein
MAARARIAFGFALLIAALAVIGRAIPWVSVPLLLLAVFVIIWGKEQRATEAFVKNLPMGQYILAALDTFVPRDREYNEHIRIIIEGYDVDLRKALRTLYRTRNTSRVVSQHLSKFVADGFIEYPKDGPGWIKPELRDIVGRTLDDLGA